jgi:tetratricopeptide (TPR) repeat protein
MRRSLLLTAVVAVLVGACATAPEAEPPDAERDEAQELQNTINEYELGQFAEAEKEQGDNAFNTAEAAYEEGEYNAALAGFTEAIDNYRTVIQNGLGTLVAARRSETEEIRQQALDVKADVAVSDAFEVASATYEEALAAEGAGDLERALELFEEAESEFQLAYDQAVELREEAQQALERVGERRQELENQREELEEETREELENPLETVEEEDE